MQANMPSFTGKRVLITGGCGFLGSNLARRLINDGAKVSIKGKLAEVSYCMQGNAIIELQEINNVMAKTAKWVGTYEYGEFAPSDFGSNQTWVYNLEIYKEENQLKARLDIDGFQALIRIQAITRENNGNLDIIFDSYLPKSMYTPHKKGDVLFSLEKVLEENYKIIWNKLRSNLLNPVNAEFKKIQN